MNVPQLLAITLTLLIAAAAVLLTSDNGEQRIDPEYFSAVEELRQTLRETSRQPCDQLTLGQLRVLRDQAQRLQREGQPSGQASIVSPLLMKLQARLALKLEQDGQTEAASAQYAAAIETSSRVAGSFLNEEHVRSFAQRDGSICMN